MSNVLIYTNVYLPASEAFIAKQTAALATYTPHVLVSKWAAENTISPDGSVVALRDSASGKIAEIALKLMRSPHPLLYYLASKKLDLIHAHFGMNGFVIEPLALKLGIPLITTFHGFDATYSADAERLPGVIQRKFMRNRHRFLTGDNYFIAVSKFIRRKLIELGCPEDRIYQHYIGIDTKFFSPALHIAYRPFRVICNSRFVDYKGHTYIIDALEYLVKNGIPIELVLIGAGPLKEKIEKRALQVLPKVEIFENIGQEQVRELLASSAVFAHAAHIQQNGHTEALGIALLEAQAMGTPVVAFDTGGVAEAISAGTSGILVPELNTGQFISAIASILLEPGVRQNFSKAARSFVAQEFNLEAQARKLEGIYDEIRRIKL
jgi:glycosyltransferase involved in cell wall biosynthesis